MRLNANFITHEAGAERIMVAAGGNTFSGMVRNNETAAFIIEELKKDTTSEQLVDAVYAMYDAPRNVIERDVKKVLDALRSIGAIDE